MNPEYRKTLKIRAEHVDFRRKMRISVLMRLFQESCIAHTEELGFARDKTLDKGLLWVIANEHILISRLPDYDEEVTLVCYPGPTLHYLFPRHFYLLDAKGNTLVEISAIWTLIEEKTRSMTDPKKKGIVIDGYETGKEIPMVSFIKMPPLEGNEETIQVPYSQVDINGHLNNCAYLDIAMDRFAKEDTQKDISEIKLVYKKEIPMDSSFALAYGKVDGVYYFSAPQFSIEIRF